MQRRMRLDRAEAALLLGVPADASPATVRHAWRMWARLAHPDVGGDPEHFARLEQARRVMASAEPVAITSSPRARLPEVLQRPVHPVLLSLGALVALALATIPALAADHSSLVALAVACTPGAVAAAGVAAAVARECLSGSADRGHRIVVVSVAWLAIAVPQVLLAAAVGVNLVPVLPVLAIPIVAVVGSMDPAVGLWRPVPGVRG